MDTYWSYLQISLAVILASTGLSYALPRLKTASLVTIIVVVALSGLVPGMPLWLRAGCFVVALGLAAASLLRRRRRSSPEATIS